MALFSQELNASPPTLRPNDFPLMFFEKHLLLKVNVVKWTIFPQSFGFFTQSLEMIIVPVAPLASHEILSGNSFGTIADTTFIP